MLVFYVVPMNLMIVYTVGYRHLLMFIVLTIETITQGRKFEKKLVFYNQNYHGIRIFAFRRLIYVFLLKKILF